jgi:hypothetical protein
MSGNVPPRLWEIPLLILMILWDVIVDKVKGMFK